MSKANDARATGRPTEAEISARAFELYLQRGSVTGYELDDWLQAEAELVAQSVAANGGKKTSSEQAAEPAVRRRNGRREAVPPVPSSRRV
jgi:DUF2934 family protein